MTGTDAGRGIAAQGVRRAAAGGAPAVWSRDFALFFVARAVARLGDTMLPVALAAGLLEHGYGAGAVGLAMASTVAAFAGLVVFGGVVADRFSTRRLMIGADLVRVGTQSLAAGLFFTGHVVLWQICAIGVVNGVAGAVFQPGVASTVPRLAADVQGANGAIRVAESAAQLAGPAVAGVLVGVASPGGLFAVHAATYALSALCLLLLRLPPLPAGARATTGSAPRAFPDDLVDGWREFRSRTWLWGVIAVWCLYMIAVWGPTVPPRGDRSRPAPRPARLRPAQLRPWARARWSAACSPSGCAPPYAPRGRARPLRLLRFPGGRRGGPRRTGHGGRGPRSPGPGMSLLGRDVGDHRADTGPGRRPQPHPRLRRGRVPRHDEPVGQALAGPAAGALGAGHVLLTAGAVSLVVAATPARDTGDTRPGPGRAAHPRPPEPRGSPARRHTRPAPTKPPIRARRLAASRPCAAVCSSIVP
ncbi:hypothetical protein GCM10017687_78640 [Streptomyces echinatus]